MVVVVVVEYVVDLVSDISTVGHQMVAFTKLPSLPVVSWWMDDGVGMDDEPGIVGDIGTVLRSL